MGKEGRGEEEFSRCSTITAVPQISYRNIGDSGFSLRWAEEIMKRKLREDLI